MLHEIALGQEERNIEMIMPLKGKVRFHGLAHVIENDNSEKGIHYQVPVKKLDNLNRIIENRKVTAIKLDVENHEYAVLKGADKLLTTHKPLVYCELWDNENRRLTFDLMLKTGYGIFVLEKQKLVSFDINKHRKQNFFFLPT
jgi:hypothetical protein